MFTELCVEVRTTKGWENPNEARNEAWDLSYYFLGLCVSALLGIEQVNWEQPPAWLADWDDNTFVTAPNEQKRFVQKQATSYDFGKLAASLA